MNRRAAGSNRHCKRWIFGVVASLAPLVGANAQMAVEPNGVFTGCEDGEVLEAANTNPRAAILSAAGRVDPKTERVFRSFSIDEASDVAADEFATACWSRLDGVWREQMRVTFDRDAQAEGWAAESPSMLEFAHGSYTTPMYLVIEPALNYTQALRLRSGLWPGEAVMFMSKDGLSIADLSRDRGKSKRYRSATINGRATDLTVDVTASGYLRLRLGERAFQRPRPDISRSARGQQVPVTDIFAIAYNPKNMRANRQGYDVTKQNPDRFLDSGGTLDVFAVSRPRDYYVREQVTVPLGLKLVEEGAQGTVYFESLLSSEVSYQEASRSSFGVGATVTSRSKDANVKDQQLGSVGYSHAQSQFNALTTNNAVSTVQGYQRYKKYALVRDHPFSELSTDFVDAVADAKRSGDYARLVRDFGTHYPYAATYGSAGQLTTHMTEEAVAQNMGDFVENSGSAGLKLGPVDFSANFANTKDIRQGNRVQTRYGTTTFSAVGGNGSWNESGFVAGDAPYPILMDLRPIDELLNPMYFPYDPDVHTRVRAELGLFVTSYLAERGGRLSGASLLANVEPIEKWQLTHTLWCSNGGAESDQQLELVGTISLSVKSNPKGARAKSTTPLRKAQNDPLWMACNGKLRALGGRQTLVGTRPQMKGLRFQARAAMKELDFAGILDPDDDVRGSSPIIRVPSSSGTAVGGKVSGRWRIPHPDGANLTLRWQFKRIQ